MKFSKSNILKDFERYIKKNIKGKLSFSKALMIAFLMTGYFSYSADLWIEYKGDLKTKGNDLNEATGVWNARGDMTNPKDREATILSSGSNRTGSDTSLRNKNFNRTVVIGSRAVGGGSDSTSIGYRAIVGKNLGTTSIRDSHQGTAVGYRTFAYGNEATSIGNDTVAYGESSISIGSDTVGKKNTQYSKKALSYDIWKLFHDNGHRFNYTSEYAAIKDYTSKDESNYKTLYENYLKLETENLTKNLVAWRTHNWAYGDSSIAIGSRNVAYGESSLAIGTSSIAKGDYSTALGTGTLSFGNSSVALGNEVFVYSDQSAGVGNNVQALKKGSMVYGLNSYAGGEGSVAIGTRALVNVKIKGEHKNIVNDAPELVKLEELYNGNPNDNQNETYKRLAKLDENKENLYNAQTELQKGTGEYKAIKNDTNGAVAIGYYVIASGENSLALGRQAYSKGERSVAIGPYAYSKGNESFALGYGSKSIGNNSFAIGAYSRSEGKDSIAFGINSKVLSVDSNDELNGENSLALGNDTIVKMKNSVALGYKSTTNYFYNGDKNTPTLSGTSAIGLEAYYPEGSTYSGAKTNEASGVISVGGWDEKGKVGLRRIVGVAPGALDSDVATVGQLKTLAYVKKEGVVTYYTQLDNGDIQKLVKSEDDNKFYVVDTKNGEPLDKSNPIDKEKVFAGPKGANEKVVEKNGKTTADMGEKIRFGHLQDAQISSTSDQAVTGAQLNSVKDVLGVNLESSNIKFERPSFNAIEYVGSKKIAKNTFKDAINETITAINKGYKFSDGDNSNTIKNTPFYLGSTIEIKPGDISKNNLQYKSSNLTTKLKQEGQNSKAIFEIGIKEEPEFKKVKITDTPTDKTHAVNKAYVDGGLTHYVSVNYGSDKSSENYNNDGAKANKAIAIGVGASVDVPNSVVIGSNINVTQETGAKNEKDAVIAIGSGVNLKNSKSSIVMGTVYEGKADNARTTVDEAAWALVLGNKTQVKGGSDIVALGNNIKVNKTNGQTNANSNLIIMGNQANATNANGSVVIGHRASATVQNGIALGSNSVAGKDKDIIGLDTVTNDNKTSASYGAWKSKYAALSIGDSNNGTRQITGLAAGKEDTDAVNVAQLKNATLHFISINGGNKNNGNYKNNGATGNNAIAIGIGASATGEKAISIGYETKATTKHSLALGHKTEIKVSDENLKANESIAIGVADNPTVIENAAWAIAIGNNTKVSGGNDIVALGSNIEIKGADNGSTVVIGNASKSNNSTSSVIIGYGAKAENVNEVVVIGKNANVAANATGSIALGKESKATKNEKSESEYTATTLNNLKFNGFRGAGENKSVLSIGDTGKERLIKNVAPGVISATSTDAINGSQLYSVIDVFGHLGATVLGAEVDDTKGFKQSTFENVKYKDSGSDKKKTFKAAIDETIKAINKGIVISDGSKNGTLQLGETLTIKPGNVNDSEFSSNNIKTHYESNNILIGIKDKPEFKQVTVSKEVKDDSDEKVLTTKKYVTGKLAEKADKFNKGNIVGSGLIEVTGGENAIIGTEVSIDLNEDTKNKIALIGTGEIKENNNGTVTGKTVYEYMKDFSNSLILSKDGTEATSTINLKTDKLQVKGEDGISVEIKDKNITVKIDENSKAKIDDILTKNEAKTDYAKVDASNITGNEGKWRSKLNVYTKDETDQKITSEISGTKFGLKGNDGQKFETKVNNFIEIKGSEEVKNDEKNIYVSKDTSGLKIQLGETLTGIKKITNGKDSQKLEIDLDETNGLKISSNGTELTFKDGLNLNDKQIKGIASGIETDADNTANISKVLDGSILNENANIGKNVVNVKDLSDVAKAIIDKGLKFVGNDNQEVTIKLGETLKIAGEGTNSNSITTAEGNIKVSKNSSNDGLQIGLSKDLKGITTIGKDDSNGITFNTDATTIKLGGVSLSLNKTSDKVKISGLANGIADNDAVNKLQLNSVVTALGGDAKIDSNGNIVGPTFKLNNKETKTYNTVDSALKALYGDITTNKTSITTLNDASIKFSDGSSNNTKSFERKNSDNDKHLVFKGDNNINVILGVDDTNKTGTFNVSLKDELTNIKSITLKDNSSIDNKTGKITIDTSGNVKVKHGDSNESKIVVEDNLKVLNGGSEIKVSGAGKVFGDISLTLNDKSIDNSKLKDATITEEKLNKTLTDKINKTFKVKVGNGENNTSENLIGSELEFAIKDANLKVELDKASKKITYGLSKDLKGIESITKGDSKSKIELKDDSIVLSPINGKDITLNKEGKISGLSDGKIEASSTEVITGNQIYELGKTHLGLKVADDNSKFIASEFNQLMKINGTDKEEKASTFVDAINKNIDKINEGLKFAIATTTSNESSSSDITRLLGSTLKFAGDEYIKPSIVGKDTIKYSVEVVKNIDNSTTENNTTNNKLVTADAVKQYVTNQFSTYSTELQLQADNSTKEGTPKGKVNLKNSALLIKGDSNIETSVEDAKNNVSIKLKDVLTNISSIEKDKNKISLTDGIGFKVEDSTFKLSKDGLDLDSKQIKNIASGIGSTSNNVDNINKILDGSISTTSQDISKNAVNIKDLSDVSKAIIGKGLSFEGNSNNDKVNIKLGDTLKIAGEGTNSNSITTAEGNIKVSKNSSNDGLQIGLSKDLTGITSIGKDENNKINFNDNNTTIKIGEKNLTLTKDADKIKISNVANGQIDTSSTDAITGTQLSDLASKLGVNVKSDKTGFDTLNFDTKVKYEGNTNGKEVATFKGAIDELITAVNKGINFEGNTGGSKELLLGSTLNIKGKEEASHKNINTVSKDNGLLEISLNEHLKGITSIEKDENNKINFNDKDGLKISSNGTELTFKTDGLNLNDKQIKGIASGIGSTSNNTETINKILDGSISTTSPETSKNAVNIKDLSDVSKRIIDKGLKFVGNDNQEVTRKLGETLKIVGEGTDSNTIITVAGNIKVSKNSSNDGLQIGLSKELKGIESISKENTKIVLGENSEKKSIITFKVGGNDVTLTEGVLSGISELNKEKDKSSIKLGDNTVELISSKDKGNIKISNNKIEISPEKDITLTLEKDTENGKVKATGLSTVGLDDNNALIFKDSKASLKVNGTKLEFTKESDKIKISNVANGKIETSSTDAITGTQLSDLASKLGVTVNTNKNGFENPTFSSINGENSNGSSPTTFKDAIDKLITAVNGGITFKGHSSTTAKLQLGETLNIDSSKSKIDKNNIEKEDITLTLSAKDKNKNLTLTLNKSDEVKEDDERAVTSKAVAEKLKEYTTTEDLSKEYLKVDGSNIFDNQAIFGKNVGISEIILEGENKSTTELLQAQALVDYLKGSGEKSVKLSDSNNTISSGEGSVSIGYDAKARNEGSIALGYNSEVANKGSISIGQDSNVIGVNSIGIGKENDVKSNFSFVIGDENKLSLSSFGSYVLGSNNEIQGKNNISIGSRNIIEGDNNILLGSNIEIDDSIQDTIVLGNNSQAIDGTLSIGNYRRKRRIVFVDNPINEYDAANKKYVDERGIKFKGNEGDEQLVKLDKLLTLDSSESKINDTSNEKDIKTKVETDKDGAKLTLTLNKATEVKENDDRVVTSKAVATEVEKLNDKIVNTKIKYKANGQNEKEVKLTEGLNFLKAENSNIEVTVGDDGKITHSLANTIKEIEAILGGKDETGAKITLEKSKKEISFNDSKLTSLADGEISKDSKEAINGKQIFELATNKLGLEEDNGSKKLVLKTNKKIKHGADKEEEISSNPLTLKTIDEKIIDTINKGYKYSADKNSVEDKSHYLGSTLSIVRLEDKISNSTIDMKLYKGDNLITKYTYGNDGNAKIEIGFKETPTFTNVTLNKEQTYDRNDVKGNEKDVITKGYLEKALDEFKIKVKVGKDKEYKIGRDDTLNLVGGLNINLDGEEKPSTITTPTTPSNSSTTSDTTSTTTQTQGNTVVATIGTNSDLKNISSITSKEKDASKESMKISLDSEKISILKNKGNQNTNVEEILSIKEENGKGTLEFSKDKTDSNKSKGVIKGLANLEHNATGDMAVNKEYVDRQVKELDANRPFDYYLDTEKVVKGQDGKFYKEDDLKDATYKDGKYTKKDGQMPKELDKEMIVIKAEPNSSPMKLTNIKYGEISKDSKDAITGSQLLKTTGAMTDEKGNITFADGRDGKAGKDGIGSKGLTSKDGLNGKNANDKANALRNGEAGSVVYTDKDGNRLVKGTDGKYYKASEALEENGTLKDISKLKAIDNPILSLVNTDGETTNSINLGNIKSALGVDEKVKDKAITKEEVNESITNLVKMKGKELEKGLNLADLQTAVIGGLNFKGNKGDVIHKNLSETIDIVGKGYDESKFKETDNNIAVMSIKEVENGTSKDKLAITLNESLTGMKSFETKVEDGKQVKLNNDGLKVVNNNDISIQDSKGLRIGEKTNDGKEEIDPKKQIATYSKEGVSLEKDGDKADYKLGGITLKDKENRVNNITPEHNMLLDNGNRNKFTAKDIVLTDKENNSSNLTSKTLTFNQDEKEVIKLDVDKSMMSFSNNNGVIRGLVRPEQETDAVNKAYVDDIKAKTDEKIDDLSSGISGVIAMANLPQITNGEYRHNIGAAIGQHKDKVALALGISGTNEKGNLVYKASGSITSKADISLGAGLGYQFGVNRSKELVDINSIKKVVNKHTNDIKEMKKENKDLRKEINELKSQMEEMKKMFSEVMKKKK